SPEQLTIVQGILKDHLPKGTLAWAFGSRVTWTAKPFSDLDIALEGAAPLPSDVLIDLKEAFEASDLPWKVDVIDLNAVSPEFRAIVEQQRVQVIFDVWLRDELGKYMDFSNGKSSPERTESGSFPVYGSNGLIGWSEQFNAPAGTTIIGRVGSYCGSTHYSRVPCWVTDNAIKATAKNEKEHRFWNYALENQNLHTLRSGSGQPLINQTSLKALELVIPPKDQRLPIGELLASLDDKIELNRRMNETLEAMARAVFRDWFVDFGPTRRKTAGLTDPAAILGGLLPDPPKAAPLAALFPDGFGGNGLPEGWELERLDRYLGLAYGKALTKKDRVEGDYPVYGSGGISGSHNVPLENGPAIIVGRKGTVGSLYWEDRDFFAIDTVFYVVPKTRLSFLFYILETLGLEHMNTDAAVPGLNRNNVYRLERAFGCEATRNVFADLADQFRAMIRNNEQENQILAATRDLLLPKLMSGELRLTGAEGAA
ncbi:MAG: restriction endonuclease subunit S, partial [Hyphomicrobiaceae bacterium]